MARPVRIAPIIISLILFLQPSAPQQKSAIFKGGVTVVNVPVTVRKNGDLVTNLDKSNFQILDGGTPQEIHYFAHQGDLPLDVGLVVDVSGSVRGIVKSEKAIAGEFLERVLRPKDSGMVVGFAHTISIWQDFTPSIDRLKAGLSKLRPVVGPAPFVINSRIGGTVLYDAISVAATEKFHLRTGTKVMVVISDGLDTNSSVTSESAARSAEAMEVVVYSICVEDSANSSLAAYRSIHEQDPIRYMHGCDALKAISEPTGGRMFSVGKDMPLEKIFDIIREEIRSQYLLGFSPSNPARAGTFRNLQIRTTPDNLNIQARKGYYTFKANER